MIKDKAYYYKYETLNIWTHGFGVVFFFLSSIYLVIQASISTIPYSKFSTIIFGISLILLYSASTRYHWAKRKLDPRTRRFQMYDHLGIYYLIAGSYTPFVLINMGSGSGWRIFYSIWIIAIIGTIFKLIFKNKYKLLSLFLYIIMGWIILIDFNELQVSSSSQTLYYIIFGGVLYSIGTIFYIAEKIRYNHPIWHLFVLGGSFCHYLGVLSLL